MNKMRYRLALDLGSTSLGWAMVRLNAENQPCAIIKSGVRIFSDGRNPKDGSSLAVTRREARAMRRRRDRLLKRKARMMKTLIAHGFFPQDEEDRKLLERSDPFALRAKGLDQALRPDEFARALFHINQRRGFKSNRKTDKKENDSGALKTAISQLRQAMQATQCRTVGEWLNMRHQSGLSVRARYRQHMVQREDGKTKTEMRYDLYIDRAMIEGEFDALWQKQSELNPNLFTETARAELKDCLLHQRPLKPVKPGRCTLMPEEERAPLALPSQQRFRIYQEVNNLRLLKEGLNEEALSLDQRNQIVQALEGNTKRTFTQIKKLIGFSGDFNLEDEKRAELKGNSTSAMLCKKDLFGPAWFDLSEDQQDSIVMQLVKEENEATLVRWLQDNTGIDEANAERVANTNLAEGYGSLCAKALQKILPALKVEVITYDKAVLAAGFDHHSNISHASTGEILPSLPYYGEYLQRHVGFGTGKPEDTPEKRYGKIANPTVHIGLNQIRTVVNALIKRYGHPSEVIIELARDLKQSQEQRKEEQQRQATNQKRNQRMREDIAALLHISADRVKTADLQKMILWEELSFNVADRRCPYSGVQISAQMLFSDQVEIEHILPFSETLDDSLSNKTVAMRQANRIKGNRTPWQAKDDFAKQGWATEDMLGRAELMPRNKRYRFSETGYAQWLRDDKGFLARALNDTRHFSRVAKEYMSLICPQNTRAVPGQLTAMLRGKFGLNNILGLDGEKNRNDHRHHAVDACVIAVTDQGMLQRFAQASANARQQQLGKLVDNMPMPWPTYREHVQRAVENIWVSHKPDHGHEGAMHNDTAYGLGANGKVRVHKMVEGVRTLEESSLKVIAFSEPKASARHGVLPTGDAKPYKGYKGDSNYCIEIVRNEKGKWEGEVVSTFEAYQIVRKHGFSKLRHPTISVSNKPLVMRLLIDDIVKLNTSDNDYVGRIATISGNGQIFMAPHNEANVDARNRSKEDAFSYISKMAGSLQKAHGRRVTISPIGELKDLGFQG
ncbi:type II CRISPR RNA-guided endonuclease Cas9 [Limnohabitans sp. Jir61]|uniref:type II CRISPR RNA-guided endonuclease Cas9 n=1 Tax=Limnohabitans sp. Jir61 TaxID=1826168 RepID=UPI000D3A0E70|nr:type II CRISPR RNA-guided endonuclease Cas9 [Limnohabitans sp. Jir61]PUE30762.1 type II CRISPR RNA-guided endonuclease Cas9 [Limnohabitans sp. Jir61]